MITFFFLCSISNRGKRIQSANQVGEHISNSVKGN